MDIKQSSKRKSKNDNHQNNEELEYTIVMLGSGGVGKSAFTVMLVSNYFIQYYDPTIEDSYKTEMIINDQNVTINILDTAGQEEYLALRDQYIRNGDGFVILYSITSNSSFLEISPIREQIYRILDRDFIDELPIAVCGNKLDLKEHREVTYEEVNNLTKTWNVIFNETSAKLKLNVVETIHDLVLKIQRLEKIVRPKVEEEPKKHRCVLL